MKTPIQRKDIWIMLLGRKPAEQAIIIQTLASLMLHVIYSGILVYAHLLGMVSLQATLWLIAVYLGQSAIFYALIRSGISRHLGDDPALTQAHIFVSLIGMAASYLTMSGGQGVLITMPMMMMMIGAFALTPKQTIQTAAIAVSSLLLVIAWCAWDAPTTVERNVQLYYFIMALVNLSVSAALAHRLSQMMGRLRRQREEIKAAMKKIQVLASQDQLTGLSNRHHLHELLGIERQRFEQEGTPFCVGLFDLDLFKSINDNHGHARGDQVLREFADLVKAQIRGPDIVGRWGGEEFLVVMPNTILSESIMVMEKVRLALCHAAVGRLPPGAVTVSGGVAEYVRHEALDTMLERADQGLYASKAQGRNLVIAAPELL